MVDVRLIDVDITDRANGKLPVWDSAAGTHVYEDPSTSGVPAGSSFPGSPATNDLFFHTTYGMIFFWNGTRWLSVDRHILEIATQRLISPVTATATFDAGIYQDGSIWVEKFMATLFVLTTNDNTRYWTAACEGVTLSTQNLAANTTHVLQGNVNAVKAGSASPTGVTLTKVSTPGNLIPTAMLTWRYIGT